MSKYLHRTSRTNSSAPSISEIDVGEICINASTLGSVGSGFNNGRLYIKLENGEIKRFIGLGLPGSSDAALKAKYGGTNNTFSTASLPTNNNAKSLLYFNFSGNGDHTLDKSVNDSLTWDITNNRLKVGPPSTSAALATLDVNGNVRISTVSTFSGNFNVNFNILGWNSSDSNLAAIPSLQFLSFITDNSLPQAKISGVVSTSKGGTGVDLSTLSLLDGNVFFYNSVNQRFNVSSNLRWDNSVNRLSVSGSIVHPAATDGSNNAVPLGLDSTDRIVRLTSSNINNLSFSKVQVGSQIIEADSNTDTLTLQAGAGISITANSASDSITIASTSSGGGGGGSLPLVNAVNVESEITLTSLDDKYQFLTPNNNYNIILSAFEASEGLEFFIRNMDSSYILSVYNDSVSGPNLLAQLRTVGSYYESQLFGSFVFDGGNWRLAFIAK
jgi:hypothetical protein